MHFFCSIYGGCNSSSLYLLSLYKWYLAKFGTCIILMPHQICRTSLSRKPSHHDCVCFWASAFLFYVETHPKSEPKIGWYSTYDKLGINIARAILGSSGEKEKRLMSLYQKPLIILDFWLF
jgi:hypothetical protein